MTLQIVSHKRPFIKNVHTEGGRGVGSLRALALLEVWPAGALIPTKILQTVSPRLAVGKPRSSTTTLARYIYWVGHHPIATGDQRRGAHTGLCSGG